MLKQPEPLEALGRLFWRSVNLVVESAIKSPFDMVRGGARLVLSYDAPGNSFRGTVENTTNNVLTRVRIEVHLSNGTELGPTPPIDLAPNQAVASRPALDAGIVHRMGSPRRG